MHFLHIVCNLQTEFKFAMFDFKHTVQFYLTMCDNVGFLLERVTVEVEEGVDMLCPLSTIYDQP